MNDEYENNEDENILKSNFTSRTLNMQKKLLAKQHSFLNHLLAWARTLSQRTLEFGQEKLQQWLERCNTRPYSFAR